MTAPARLATLCAALLCLVGAPAQAVERITDFESRIEVQADASMIVTERITVLSDGRKIKRGIYRDFPTRYRDRYGNSVTVDFEVQRVLRGGEAEPYHSEQRSNGVRVYIGSRNVLIPHGEHVYTIVYRTDRQLGFFDGFDELYWNVTGNGWDFPIEQARAFVTLPPGAEIQDWAAYTGRQGERGGNFEQASATQGATFALVTTRPLAPREGLTIAVAWPPGFVARPDGIDRIGYLLSDNKHLVAGVVGFFWLLAYYVIAWRSVGRDPEGRTIIAEYDPPAGISPAAARYIMRMGSDNKTFTAAVVSLAVKGYLIIGERGDEFILEKTGEAVQLSPGERATARKLFRYESDQLVLEQVNHPTLQAAQEALQDSLKSDFERTYFRRNTGFFLPGAVITVVTLAAMAALSRDAVIVAAAGFWFTALSVAFYFVWRKSAAAWHATKIRGTPGVRGKAFLWSILFLPVLAGLGAGVTIVASVGSWLVAPAMLAVLLLDVLFYQWLKAPTRLGRRTMDHIEGFERYLAVAEQDRMNLLNPPDRTPELFERYLPYALALDVEQAWSEQFADVLAAASVSPDDTRTNGHYRPRWYSGHSFSASNLGGFSATLGGSLSDAIASASTPPGSDSGSGGFSGSGGGGFSGGGGGGGGGGGW